MENGEDRSAGQFSSETIGRRKYVEDLLLELNPQGNQANDDDLRVISFADSEATGKTAFVRTVYDTLHVRRWFPCRAWVRVQDDFFVEDILVNILRQISTHEFIDADQADDMELSRRLHKYFWKQRYLIVLDNISSANLLSNFLSFLIDYSNGSKVIITTRNVDLPLFVDPWGIPIKFDRLSEEDRERLLLRSMSFNQLDKQVYAAPLCITQRICSLAPAGIPLLGGLLDVNLESENLESIICGLAENPPLVDVVSLCYDELRQKLCHNEICPKLQDCIMYFCLFPREYEIPTRRLLRLWLAESLVPASDRGIENAEGCFRDLVRRNMIHVVSRGKRDGVAKTCLMPGFIYDFLCQKALEMGFFEYYSNGSSADVPKGDPEFVAPGRIVVHKPSINNKLGGSSETKEQPDRRQYDVEELHTYISFNINKIKMQKRELEIVLNPKGKESSLEVLDLEGVYKPVFPKNLGDFLLKLKYLGLRWTTLDELPKSVGNLPCLETLDVKHTNIKKLPSSIWTKNTLRHLYLNEVNFEDKAITQKWCLSRSKKLPSSLETLCGLYIEGKSPMINSLSKLARIKKLSLTCRSTVVEEVIKQIKRLTTLQSLRLKSKDLLGQPAKLYVVDMKELVSLSYLYLFGSLQGSNLSFLPNNLKSLTLSMSSLATDAMENLGNLEHLTDLRLYAFSFKDETLKCAGKTFSKLRFLKLWKLGNLESFIVEKEAMSCLEELDIRGCQKLGKIQILGTREALKEVSLVMVEQELAKSLERSLGPSVVITSVRRNYRGLVDTDDRE